MALRNNWLVYVIANDFLPNFPLLVNVLLTLTDLI